MKKTTNQTSQWTNNKQWWHYSIEELSKELQTDPKQGLTIAQAEKHLKKFGPNKLPEQKGISVLGLFINQFSSFIVWILIGALVISGMLGEWIDAISIGVIVIFNAIIGFVQEYSAERSLAALRKLTKPTSQVIRQGVQQEVPSSELVPGDLVLLEAGDPVPADGRIIQVLQLATQEAALTGESISIHKTVAPIPDKKLPIGDRKNMAFMGTVVVYGRGQMIVTETALASELGNIATILQTQKQEKTPLQIRLEQLGHKLVIMCLIIVALVFVVGLLRGNPLIEMILTSLSLAVAAIPEGLPAVVIITLAVGVRKMAKRNALVRRLPSVETLGRASVICTDKTGTLTQNKMVIRSVYINNSFVDVTGTGYKPEGTFERDNTTINPNDIPELMLALKTSVLCNNANIYEEKDAWHVAGDPMEGALLTAAAKAGLTKQALEKESPLVQEIPFSSERHRMSMIRDTPDGRIIFVKGTPDTVLDRCTTMLINGQQIPLTAEDKKRITEALNQLARKALRILSLAYRPVNKDEPLDESLENDLIFIGLIAMIDPPRPEVKQAIHQCKKAGIFIAMITGDYKETAIAIAKELDLMEENSLALDGAELEETSDEFLKENIEKIAVYARVTVEQKMRIVQTWKMQGHIVAMTGDGVNDAPAIKAADIGIAMGSGTEVTKEASDMVIIDDNFASIVNAVEEGRGIYDNIIKFVNYLISSNIAELLIIFIGLVLGFTDPQGNLYISLLPIQLLWINLVTDGFPAIALGLDPLDPYTMDRPPKKPSDPILSFSFAMQLFLISIVIAVGTLIACHFGLKQSAKLGHTITLNTLVVLELVRVQMIRSQYHIGFFSNLWLILALALSFSLQLLVTYVPALQKIFKTVSLGITEWLIILATSLCVWLASRIIQYFFRVTPIKNR